MATPYVPATEQLVVEVYVRNLDRAVEFYRRLGFEILGRKGGFAAVTWEGHRLFLDERPHYEPPPSPPTSSLQRRCIRQLSTAKCASGGLA